MKKMEVKQETGYELYQRLLSEKRKLISEKLILDKKDGHMYPIENTPFSIPGNWHWCYLSDVSIIQEGPGIRKHQYQDDGIQFLTVTNILEDAIDLQKSKKYISRREYEKTYSHFTINKGDIVTACSGGSWGKSAIFDLEHTIILNTSTLRLRFFNDLGENKYLYYFTKTSYFKDSLSSYITGQQPNYGYFHYSKIPIPLPPLPEQQRIVAFLDEAFAAIARAKAHAEQNLQNAKALFESYLQGVFASTGSASGGDGWEKSNLEDYIKLIDYRGRTPQKTESGVRLITAKNVKLGYLQLEPQEFIAENNYETWMTRGIPNVGDVIFTTEAPLANVAQIESDEKLAFAQRIIVMQPMREKLNPTFLKYMLLSEPIRKRILERGTGATVVGIKSSLLKKIPISFPKSVQTQQSIVRQLDALHAETQRLEAVYRQKLEDLEELKKSLLSRAFGGQLSESGFSGLEDVQD